MKTMLKKLKDFLAGKKSYLASLGLLISGLIEYSQTGDLSALINRILEALAVAGLRAGIAKK